MILQFGAGNFLRAFADLFIDEINRSADTPPGPIIVVQSTGKERADALNQANGCYHVAIQGFQDGAVVDETIEVASIGRALHAGSEWDQVIAAAIDPDLSIILSNTTEAGLTLEAADTSRGDGAPTSFPAKLLAVLIARHADHLPGPWIVPCELIESNGDRLRDLVLEQAALWEVSKETCLWLSNECLWINTLVDRIVPGPPKNHPLSAIDPLLLSAEPFAFWAVETDRTDFPLAGHPAVTISSDITPYTLRKVRILNGAHTALVCRAAGTGVETVRECLEHPEIGPWLEKLLLEEIVPVLEGRCDDPAGFSRDVLDRFRNPFLEHSLSAIALNHDSKVAVRLQPTIDDYREKFGKEPPLLSALFQ